LRFRGAVYWLLALRHRSGAREHEDRLRILDAAHAVFGERGLQATLAEVAARAAVGAGTVYRRFADRGAIVTAGLECLG